MQIPTTSTKTRTAEKRKSYVAKNSLALRPDLGGFKGLSSQGALSILGPLCYSRGYKRLRGEKGSRVERIHDKVFTAIRGVSPGRRQRGND